MTAPAVGRVEVQVARDAGRLPGGRRTLCRWAERLHEEIGADRGTWVLRLVGEEEMSRLNATYRGKERATDVLAFPGETEGEEAHLGDVAICLPVAARQAEELGHPIAIEVRVLALHGLLHCLGFDHETDDGEMEAEEGDLRRRWIPEAEVPG